MYLGHAPFNAGSVSLVLKPATGYFSPQLHVVFDNEFSTVPFIMEVTIPTNLTDLVQRSSLISEPDNIDPENYLIHSRF